MSFAYVSSPGVPTMRPKNLSGVGTVADAGRWSTSSVVMRGSWRYSLIFAVYSASMRWPATLVWACAGDAAGVKVTALRVATAAATRRTDFLACDIVAPDRVGWGAAKATRRWRCSLPGPGAVESAMWAVA